MEIPKTSIIPIYLEAQKKDELMQLMYANNAINGRAFNYMNPIRDGKKWVVWFYADIDNYKKPNRKDLGLMETEIR
jgi:hypothetical protein